MNGVSGDWVYINITFSKAFASTPFVNVYLFDTRYATNWELPMIRNITKTGFTFGWYNMAGTRQIIWQAIGNI